MFEHAAAEHRVELAVAVRQGDHILGLDVRLDVRVPRQTALARRLGLGPEVERADLDPAAAKQIGHLPPTAAPVEQQPGAIGRDPVGDRDVLEHLRRRTQIDVCAARIVHPRHGAEG